MVSLLCRRSVCHAIFLPNKGRGLRDNPKKRPFLGVGVFAKNSNEEHI